MPYQRYEIYELLDLDSGNIIADFACADDALAAMQRVAKRDGWPSVSNLSLMRVQDDEQRVMAMREHLVEMARSLTPAR